MNGSAWVVVGLLALAGFLLGGVWSLWRTTRLLAGILAVTVVLAVATGVVWALAP